ncbi:MAG: MlaE family ABC transporter permease [Thermodesulfobacteriota bacterium]
MPFNVFNLNEEAHRVHVFAYIGFVSIRILREMGAMVLFAVQFLATICRRPLRLGRVVQEMHFIGVKSLFVIILVGAFSGMVLALQGFYALRLFGSEGLLGSAVSLGLVRELGPVLGALMVGARAGSAMTAEIGIMKISEQILALDVMTIDPLKYLVTPKIIASILVLPLLISIFDVVGIFSGYAVAVGLLDISSGSYMDSATSALVFQDVFGGFIKSLVFGFTLAWVCCYKGYNCEHGAKGVSNATTEAVVLASVLIFVLDYLLTSLLL